MEIFWVEVREKFVVIATIGNKYRNKTQSKYKLFSRVINKKFETKDLLIARNSIRNAIKTDWNESIKNKLNYFMNIKTSIKSLKLQQRFFLEPFSCFDIRGLFENFGDFLIDGNT